MTYCKQKPIGKLSGCSYPYCYCPIQQAAIPVAPERQADEREAAMSRAEWWKWNVVQLDAHKQLIDA